MRVLVIVSKNNRDKIEEAIRLLKKNNSVLIKCVENINARVLELAKIAQKIVIFADKKDLKYFIEANIVSTFFTENNFKVSVLALDDESDNFFRMFFETKKINVNKRGFEIELNSLSNLSKSNIVIKKKYDKKKIIFAINLFIFIVSSFMGITIEKNIPNYNSKIYYWLIFIIFVITILILIIFVVLKVSNTLFKERTSEAKKYSEKVRNALVTYEEDDNTTKKDKNINALGRMELNLEDIKEFYVWTKKQSKSAFILAIGLIIFGILSFIIIIITSIILDLKSSISIIGGVGSIIIEFIGATALVVYKLTLSQFNHYHRSLHEDERFLSSVNLINNLSEIKEKDEMIKKIINSELELNLIEVKEKMKSEK